MTLRFSILGTGSSGNCALLQTATARVLIDGGFSARKTGQLLTALGTSLEQIDALFITHEHGDHSAIVSGLAKYPHIKLFANASTSRVLQRDLNFSANWQLFETGARFRFQDLEIETFSVPHDAQDPVGFVFTSAPALEETLSPAPSALRLAWLTDLGHAPQHIHERIRDVDILVVEANHCSELLKADNKRPWALKQRISGRHGHLSNQSTRALLDAVASPRWRHIFLTHLSRDCNTLDAVSQTFAGCPATQRCQLSVMAPGQSTPLHDFS